MGPPVGRSQTDEYPGDTLAFSYHRQNYCPLVRCWACLMTMTAANIQGWRRWPGRNPLAVALMLSVIIHLALFGTWQLGKKLGWLDHHANWLTRLTQKLIQPKPRTAALQPKARPAAQPREIPLTFVEVDPATAVTEAPKDAKHYSSKNALASNTEVKKADSTPVIDGKQDQVVRVMENEKPVPFPLQPTPTLPPRPEDPLLPKPKGEDAAKPGDLALKRPGDARPKNESVQDATTGTALVKNTDRPRTLAAARQKAMLAGQLMKQDGGVERRGSVAFDTKATPFGEYDAAFIAAVESRWHQLLDNNSFNRRAGKVTVEFKLTYDGRIIDVVIPNNEVGDILGMFCRNAIEDPAPYPKWPADMRRVIGANTREIRFTFFYYN